MRTSINTMRGYRLEPEITSGLRGDCIAWSPIIHVADADDMMTI